MSDHDISDDERDWLCDENCKMTITNGQISVQWELKNFFDMQMENEDHVYSPSFMFCDAEWNIRIDPHVFVDNSNYGEWIAMFIEKEASPSELPIEYSVGILKTDGSVYKCHDDIIKCGREDNCWGFELLPRRELRCAKDVITPSGSLLAFCIVRHTGRIRDSACQTPRPDSILTLSRNFEDMLVDGRQCDVTINVKNQTFHANRAILSARSKVFSSMFEHDTLEKANGIINIDDCDPDCIPSFLMFVYTGKLDVVKNSNACSLYKVADKYNFIDLRKECCRVLGRDLTDDLICDVVLLATLHDENQLLETATDYFIANVEQILPTAKWQDFITEYPLLANSLFMRMVEKKKGATKALTILLPTE